jgi:hypothetical protein
VLGGQVRGIRELSGAADQIGDIARAAAKRVDGDLDAAGGEPAARIDLLDTAEAELREVAITAAAIDVGADGWLVPPLAHARTKLVHELAKVDDRVDEGVVYLDALREMLTGPGDYLILAANNAEMRAGGGMPLSAGTVHIEAGDIEASDFTPTGDPRLFVQTRRALIPPDLLRTYKRFALGHDFRETSASPNFPVLGPIYADMAARSAIGPVKGVFQVDAVALRTLLAAIGPVRLDGKTYTAKNVEQQVLNENYLQFGVTEDRGERVDLQSRIAVAIFDALKEREVPVTKLAAGLANAAKGRHLLAWSPVPGLQTMWHKLGASGDLHPNGLMICAENISANKLDWYIEPKVDLEVERNQDHTFYKARLSVTMTNPKLDAASRVVAGNHFKDQPGAHRTLLAIYLPTTAVNIRSIQEVFTEAGIDGPMKMVGMRYYLKPGETRTVSITFDMPLSQRGAILLPAGRVKPTSVTVNGRTVTDAHRTLVRWDDD